MPIRLVSVLILPLLVLMTSPVDAQSTDVPIQQVVLFTSGVSYVEHAGTVAGSRTTTLRFQSDEIKDVLKSLVVQDLDGGRVGTVVYPSQEPLARTLSSFAVDLSDTVGLGPLLNQIRGATARVSTADGDVTGTIAGAEQRTSGGESTAWHLTLFDGTTLRSVPLDGVRALRLEDPALQQELTKALAALASGRNPDKKPVQIRFDGDGTRRVRVGYVVEAPVWKTSYRLILPDDDANEAPLQGWAIVENQTESDWDGVDLALVSGRPISFVQDLYTPIYADRPVIAPPLPPNVRPAQYEGGVESLPFTAGPPSDADAAPAPQARRKRQAQAMSLSESAALDPTQGVESAAEGQDVGTLFQYRVGDVTLPRGRSAMIPIVTDAVRVERVRVYDPTVHATHPLNGARLENTTGLHFSAGPVTVFDDGGYAGDARLADTPPEQSRLVSYALDQTVRVDRQSSGTSTSLQSAVIVDGVVRATRREVAPTTYTLQNEADDAATVIVVHPRRSGWTLDAPTGDAPTGDAASDDAPGGARRVETTPDAYRLRVTVGAGASATLDVRETRGREETLQLVSASSSQIAAYARTNAVDGPVREALERAVRLHAEVEQVDRQLEDVEQERRTLAEDQERIRGNLEAVDSETSYAKRLLDKLDEQEDRIESLNDRRDALREERETRAERLRDALRSLNVSG